jgi:DNA recombination protein RmuC
MSGEWIVVIVALLAAALAAWLAWSRPLGPVAELKGQIRQLTEQGLASQAELAKSLNARLDAMAKTLGESLSQSSNKTGETLAALGERLAVIDQAHKTFAELSSQLSSQVGGLQDILANKQARGAFGEVQLESIVRDLLPPSLYEFQATLSNASRADCLIRLPKPPGPIAIDAKFPLESYRALTAAQDEAARAQALRGLSLAMQKHIEDVAGKYILPGETADSALLFLPSEAIFAELHGNLPSVPDEARRRRVLIVSPTMLMFTLFTVRALLRDARMHEQAAVIQKEVGLLLADVGRLSERSDKLTSHFNQVVRDLGEIKISAEKIASRGARIESLQIEAPETAARLPETVVPVAVGEAQDRAGDKTRVA